MKNIENLIDDNGLISTKYILDNGITKEQFYKFIRENHFEKKSHGIYAKPDALIDDLYILYMRCPKCVFSHYEALYYHGLIDREPITHTLTVYSGYNTKRLRESHVKVYTVKKENLEIGLTMQTNQFGNKIPIYDLERTICDLIRSRNSIEIQDFQTALKSYVKRPDKDLNKLMKYAKVFHIEKIVRNYMEVLL